MLLQHATAHPPNGDQPADTLAVADLVALAELVLRCGITAVAAFRRLHDLHLTACPTGIFTFTSDEDQDDPASMGVTPKGWPTSTPTPTPTAGPGTPTSSPEPVPPRSPATRSVPTPCPQYTGVPRCCTPCPRCLIIPETMLLTDITRLGGARQVADRLAALARHCEGDFAPARAWLAAALTT